MKTRICVAAAAPLMLVGCVATVDPVPLATNDASYGVSTGLVVERRPPAVRYETRPASPGSRYVWVSGHWRWTGVDYEWVSGRWVLRPRASAVWVDGSWTRRNGGWAWHDGYWR